MRKLLKSLVCLLLCLCLLPVMPVFAEEDDVPEETVPAVTMSIANEEDFLVFSEACRLDSYSRNLVVELESDINLNGLEFDGIPTFSGIFHGNGHTVYGLRITGDGSHQGLFRYLEVTAVVTDLKVTGTVTPGGSRSSVGGIVGTNAGRVENCRFFGDVSGADCIGGIAGANTVTGMVSGCRAEGSIHGDHFVGGIVGENRGAIRGCENYAAVNTTAKQNDVSISDITIDTLTGSETVVTATDIGGITGISTGMLRDCANHADVGYQHMGYNIGGIAGTQSGYITGCVNYAAVRGRKEVGGIVGQMEPSTALQFEVDALEILRGQLDTLSALTGRASTNAQKSSAQLNQEILNLKDQAESAKDAVGELLPSDGTLPDADSIIAAQNALTSSLGAMSGTMNQIAAISQKTVTTLSSDLQAIGNQVQAMSTTINGAAENLGAAFTDISDSDTDGDTFGKVERCVNHGSVLADWNVGGIVGAISVENDLDVENDLEVIGENSLNFHCDARAVVLRCENRGTVTGKKENAGGISGWVSMGLVRECVNTGTVEAASADYVGGIAGQSEGFIRRCQVKANLSGCSNVGGIAGCGKTVTDCMAMVRLLTGSEKLGAILGTARGSGELLSNYYLNVERDHGGIDGISYHLIAQPLAEQAFFRLEGLSESFRSHTIRFVYDDGTEETRTVLHGKALKDKDIPAIPTVEGSEGGWKSDWNVNLDCVTFDAVFTASYLPRTAVLESQQTRENGLPILLCQGSFARDAGLEVQQGSAPEELLPVECWEFAAPDESAQLTLRFLPPENADAKELTVLVCTADGSWQERNCNVDGSYLVFTVDAGEHTFCVARTQKQIPIPALLAILAAVAAAGILLVCRIRRKKKRT